MKIVFLGTPDFATSSLEALCNSSHEVVAVVTPPDRLGNRKKLMLPAVKITALAHGLKVMQYERISREGVEDLFSLNADIFVTCAFGQILSREILSMPKYGVINVHASLLPKYRGSCPIQASIINGDSETGVAIMRTEYEVDSGDVLLLSKTDITDTETSEELFDRLKDIGASALIEALDIIERGEAVYTPQDSAKATFCHMLRKADGLINWNQTSLEVHNFIRGMYSWPCAFTSLDSVTIKVHKAKVFDSDGNLGVAGEIISSDGELIVACASGSISIMTLQLPNCKAMITQDYLRGHSIDTGKVLV